MKVQERELLERVRMQALLVATLRERCGEELAFGLRSFEPETAARHTGLPTTLDAEIIRRDELRRILAREEAQLAHLEEQARQVIAALPGSLYCFCALYYLSALSLDEVAGALGRTLRQCKRYKQMIDSAAQALPQSERP